MTTMQRDPLVDDYLRRLDASAAGLPRERRRELVAEIDEHIEAALAENDQRDEVTVRNVLERLGPPEEIAAAAEPSPPPPPTRGRLETAALIVLSASFLVPVAGYLLGAGLVISSRAWAGRDKLLGLLIPPAIVVLGGGIVAAGAASGDSLGGGLGPLEITVLIADLLSGVLAAAYLAWRLRPSPVE